MRGARRRGEGGVESLELLALLPLMTMIVLAAWQGIVIARLHAEAEADARTLVRVAVLCPQGPVPDILVVDHGAKGAQVTVDRRGAPLVGVTVGLPVPSVVQGVDLSALGPIVATVVMRQEPCI